VRVHTDHAASESARGINAYTVASEIVCQSVKYEPGTLLGQRMLTHELIHVLQQHSGPVDGRRHAAAGIGYQRRSDRFEQAAERTPTC
jgi:hypothetical protein